MSWCHTIEWCRVCLGMLKHRRLGRIHEYSPSDVCSDRINRELQRRARSNGYSVTVVVEQVIPG